MTRRSFLQYGSTAATMTLALGGGRAFGQAAKRPRLHALIVGVNKYAGRTYVQAGKERIYKSIPQLKGCVNDARAIESAVAPIAASKRLLLDQDVSAAAFMNAWSAMIAEAAEGDTLLVTYSGHGGQERGPLPSTASDGLHDTFILPAFDSSRNTERVLDDEMQALWRKVQGRYRVIFLADSCHAGGMTRAVDPRIAAGLTYRTVHEYDIDGELASRVPVPSEAKNLEVPHVLFLAGAQHDELVPEIQIDGRWQGALSLAFARALSGLADANHDGIITGAELSSYVLRTIRAMSDSNQHPDVRWPHADVRSGVAIRSEEAVFYLNAPQAPPVPKPAADVVTLHIEGPGTADQERIGRALTGARLVDESQQPDLTWISSRGEALDKMGNIVAYGVQENGLQAMVNSVQAVRGAARLVVNRGLDMRLVLQGESLDAPPSRASDRTHPAGTGLTVVASGIKDGDVILFNITGDGTVQLLNPLANKPTMIKIDNGRALSLEVAPPFGGDHLIGVASVNPIPDLIDALDRLNGKKAALEAVAAVERHAARTGATVGMQGVFTRPQGR